MVSVHHLHVDIFFTPEAFFLYPSPYCQTCVWRIRQGWNEMADGLNVMHTGSVRYTKIGQQIIKKNRVKEISEWRRDSFTRNPPLRTFGDVGLKALQDMGHRLPDLESLLSTVRLFDCSCSLNIVSIDFYWNNLTTKKDDDLFEFLKMCSPQGSQRTHSFTSNVCWCPFLKMVVYNFVWHKQA